MTIKFEIVNHGSLIGFKPTNDSAKAWWSENVESGPQIGDTFFVEPRYAEDIVHGIRQLGID